MKKIIYIDCGNGAAGDMLLSALFHKTLGRKGVGEVIRLLKIREKFTWSARAVDESGISAFRTVINEEKKREKTFAEIISRIERSAFSRSVREKTKRVFADIARTEAGIHGKSISRIHFHELGWLDSFLEISGFFWGLERLGIDEVTVSPVSVGAGEVNCRHGILPNPAPATLELLKGFIVEGRAVEEEITTPTAAAILKNVSSGSG
ncbi:MAG TPA: nickel insertion protein, partial [bacterium]|nr:nickel insertion protein [bacterium]